MKKGITYGTYDLQHQGHINLLRRAKVHGLRRRIDYLNEYYKVIYLHMYQILYFILTRSFGYKLFHEYVVFILSKNSSGDNTNVYTHIYVGL